MTTFLTADPVIVVGAGPVGLMLAAELGLARAPLVVLERRPEPATWSRAFAIHMSSVQMLRQRGLDRALGDRRFTNYNFGFPGLTGTDEEKQPLFVSQYKVETVLEERVHQFGVDLRRGHEVTGVEQDSDGVTVTVHTGAGNYQLRGSYLIGCDGGRSVVRRLAGIAFPGTASKMWGYTGDLDVLDPEYRTGIGPNPIFPGGFAAVIRHPDHPDMCRATVIEFTPETAPQDVPVTVDEFAATFERVSGIRLNIGRATWLTRFGDATRQAESYRQGRVFLAGDAAHVHFPSAGQGLNTGLQDAMNLGWKLAAAAAGRGGESLLDTYHTERHPIGHEACVYPQAQMALMQPIPRLAPVRALVAQLIKFESVSSYLINRATGLGISYPMTYCADGLPNHPLTGFRVPDLALETAEGPVGVARLLESGRGLLADLSQGGADLGPIAFWRHTVPVVTAAPIPDVGADLLLVRPDGHVAYAGDDVATLEAALAAWFGMAATVGVAPSPRAA